MALFDRFRVSGEELERNLGRPLRGDPSRGERAVLVALTAGRIAEVRRDLEDDPSLGADFRDAVAQHLTRASARWETFKSWSVSVPLPIWDEYARESRLTNSSISRCLGAAIRRDYDRRREVQDPLESLRSEVAAFRVTATQILEEATSVIRRLEGVQDLQLRLRRMEDTLAARPRSV